MHFVLNTAYPLRSSASLLRQEDSRLMQLRMKSQGTEEKLICRMGSGSNRERVFSLLTSCFRYWGWWQFRQRGTYISFCRVLICWWEYWSCSASARQEETIHFMELKWIKTREKVLVQSCKGRFWGIFFSTLCTVTLTLYLWRGANERDSSFRCLF